MDSPAVAGELAIRTENAVARYDDGCGVLPAGRGDSAHRAGRADRGGELGIGTGGAARDGLQGLPDARLEGGATQVERKRVGAGLGAEGGEHGRDMRGERSVGCKLGAGESDARALP